MEREEPEPLAARPIEEPAPAADADIFGIPALARMRGFLRKPEMPRVEQLETVFLVEHRRIFARLGPVVASDAGVAVTGKRREKIQKLAVEHLLSSENVEIVVTDQRGDHRKPPLPAVAPRIVSGIELAHIIGRRREALRETTRRRRAEGGDTEQHFFHDRIVTRGVLSIRDSGSAVRDGRSG